mgnify:CR=1 FL=1
MVRRALVAGGSGLVGSALVRILAGDAAYNSVTCLARRPAAEAGKVATQVVDFEALESTTLAAVDDAFCCLGTTRKKAGSDEAFRRVDLDYVVAFARAARNAGASRFFLVSSLGADAESRMLYPRVKGEAEAVVQGLGFRAVVIARPSVLDGDRAEDRPGEAAALVVGRVVAPLLFGPLRKYRPIAAEAVARALVVLAHAEVQGTRIVLSDELAELARQTEGNPALAGGAAPGSPAR